jgi:microcystin-dependent protein
MADFFKYNDSSIISTTKPLPGFILPYLGTSDPSGWIICDGVNRTSSDNRYQDLALILNINGVSSNTANSITPPNLQNKFLYGTSTSNSVNNTGSNNTGNVSLVINNLPSHSHTITVSESTHTHTLSDKSYTWNNQNNSGNMFQFNSPNTAAITSDSKKINPTATAANTGNGTAFSILPPYTTVNYIIKY